MKLSTMLRHVLRKKTDIKEKTLDFRVLELTEAIFIKNSQDFLVVFWSH